MEQEVKRQRGRPRAFNAPADTAQVQSLDRALRVLAVISEGSGLSLSEVAGASDIPAPTAYRMLTTFQAHGMVEFEKETQLWSIGVETYRMGAAFLRGRKLADRARSAMQNLVEAIGETSNLGVTEDDCIVFVTQVESHHAIRAFFRPGTRSAFHVSGIGKAVMAHLPEHRVAAIAQRSGLRQFTARTLTTLPQLQADLDVIRHRGWSVDDEEHNAGMRCVAAAIFNEFGEPIAGISISGPTVRVTSDRLNEIGPQVQAAAAEVTRLIGGKLPL